MIAICTCNAMHNVVYVVTRCMSVCLSVTCWYSVKMAKLFSLLDSHTIPVFPYQMVWQYSDKDHTNGSVECRGI